MPLDVANMRGILAYQKVEIVDMRKETEMEEDP